MIWEHSGARGGVCQHNTRNRQSVCPTPITLRCQAQPNEQRQDLCKGLAGWGLGLVEAAAAAHGMQQMLSCGGVRMGRGCGWGGGADGAGERQDTEHVLASPCWSLAAGPLVAQSTRWHPGVVRGQGAGRAGVPAGFCAA
jgi:hypothetical protein